MCHKQNNKKHLIFLTPVPSCYRTELADLAHINPCIDDLCIRNFYVEHTIIENICNFEYSAIIRSMKSISIIFSQMNKDKEGSKIFKANK